MNMVTAAPSVSFWPSLMIWARIVACRPPHPALPQPIAASGIISGSCALKRITQHARSRVALNRRHRSRQRPKRRLRGILCLACQTPQMLPIKISS
ncbi:hypothetical protein CN212_33270 [Sinorhizobium meliloti]|nr:hypothetical protein CN238_30695 [Sinorhizobium meliloti]RVE82874.1 hypothetical protein CN235_32485 [Sinorhizobium meliloti]RVG61820.1 hypothetical protein CN220_29945 [Sinorhizobium meliloti]RVH17539.1 hypothetical protein CN215_31625 [Sinorhizobium meliloti]RVH22543.1 hypothetical protein CN214_29295 [Sinorhizobium meliloti]